MTLIRNISLSFQIQSRIKYTNWQKHMKGEGEGEGEGVRVRVRGEGEGEGEGEGVRV